MSKTCKYCVYFDRKSKSRFCGTIETKECTGGFYAGSFVDPAAPCCPDFVSARRTIFHQLTASPEVLAEKLVYKIITSFYCSTTMEVNWYSTITDWAYNTKEEAIAATVKKLKEVCNEYKKEQGK